MVERDSLCENDATMARGSTPVQKKISKTCSVTKLVINHFANGCNVKIAFPVKIYEKRVRASSSFQCTITC